MKKRGCLATTLVLITFLLFVCGLTIWGFTSVYYGMSISPDGQTLVVTTPSKVTMYQLSDGKVVHQESGKPYGIQDYEGEFSYLAWSPDGTSLAVGQLYNGVWVWDTKTWELQTERKSEPGFSNEPSFAWSPDGQELALGTGNGTIWIWNKKDNKWVQKTSGARGLLSITWTNSGQLLKLQGHEIYDVNTGSKLSRLDHYIDGHGKASWSSDGSHVYIFFDLGGSLMDVRANKYEFNSGFFPEFAWSKDGSYFASVQNCSNEIFVWDTINNKVIRQEKQGNMIYSLAWTSTDELVALGMLEGQTVVWNTNTGEILLKMHAPPNLSCFF